MVFCGAGYGLYLLRGEPFLQALVGAYDASALQMMCLAVHGEPEVVERRGRIKHVFVDIVTLAHLQGPPDDRTGMVLLMGLVEQGIARNYLRLYILDQQRIHIAGKYKKNYFQSVWKNLPRGRSMRS